MSLFIPSKARVSRALQVNASASRLKDQVADPLLWKNWYPGADTLDILYVEGKPSGIITGPMQGVIIRAQTDSSVIAGMAGTGSKEMEMGWNFLAEDSNRATVQWYMEFRLRWYPWEKFASLLFEKQYGTQMEQGLNRLKKTLENN
jgi:hypothetical protein